MVTANNFSGFLGDVFASEQYPVSSRAEALGGPKANTIPSTIMPSPSPTISAAPSAVPSVFPSKVKVQVEGNSDSQGDAYEVALKQRVNITKCVAIVVPKNGAVYLESAFKGSMAQILSSDTQFSGVFDVRASYDSVFEIQWNCPGFYLRLLGSKKAEVARTKKVAELLVLEGGVEVKSKGVGILNVGKVWIKLKEDSHFFLDGFEKPNLTGLIAVFSGSIEVNTRKSDPSVLRVHEGEGLEVLGARLDLIPKKVGVDQITARYRPQLSSL